MSVRAQAQDQAPQAADLRWGQRTTEGGTEVVRGPDLVLQQTSRKAFRNAKHVLAGASPPIGRTLHLQHRTWANVVCRPTNNANGRFGRMLLLHLGVTKQVKSFIYPYSRGVTSYQNILCACEGQ